MTDQQLITLVGSAMVVANTVVGTILLRRSEAIKNQRDKEQESNAASITDLASWRQQLIDRENEMRERLDRVREENLKTVLALRDVQTEQHDLKQDYQRVQVLLADMVTQLELLTTREASDWEDIKRVLSLLILKIRNVLTINHD